MQPTPRQRRSERRARAAPLVRAAVAVPAAAVLFPGSALAHGGALRLTQEPVTVPLWLLALTGGGVVAASFLLASLATDHDAIRAVNRLGTVLPAAGTARRLLRPVLGAVGVLVLAAVVALGLFGPQVTTTSVAILVVWVGWWAGYAMSVYLVGNTWRLLNPWRTLAGLLPSLDRPYPDRLGPWPAVVGLVALVWLEVVSPVGERPRLLALVVLGYTVATLAGAVALGPATWFREVDPIARVFRCYGAVAPVRRTDDGVEVGLPGTALVRAAREVASPAFVVALLWVTTYDGLIATPAWAAVTRAVVGAGVPALVVYLGTAVAGFGLFLEAYRLAAARSRRTADSYVTTDVVRERFAPALLPIAAGYHAAHFLGYFLSLSPALAAALRQPLSPPLSVATLGLPGWFGGVQVALVILGHLLAIWVAHAVSFELFTGRLQPIRSQYPFIVVMVGYTVTSMWIVSRPYTPPPYL